MRWLRRTPREFAHGALSMEEVFVTRDDGELVARVFGFGAGLDDYRNTHEDVAGLAALATEIVGSSPPTGFTAWRARCIAEPITMAECVTELRALFPSPGDEAGVGTGTLGATRRFEQVASRADRRARRVRLLDRVGASAVAAALVGAAAVSAVVLVAGTRSEAPPGASAPRASTSARNAPPHTEADEATRATLDVLAADRGSCPDRHLDPRAAARDRSYRCVRAVLYQRVLDSGVGALNDEQRAALKNACAALADLGCVLRLDR